MKNEDILMKNEEDKDKNAKNNENLYICEEEPKFQTIYQYN
jgi:hypothetical protein